MSKTITLSDEEYQKVQDMLQKAKDANPPKKRTVIYKTDGSVLYESDKETVKEAVVEHKADLRGADLRGADLIEANLRWADLRGADLIEADLSWANLYGANLHGADLSGADFQNVKFYGRGGTTRIKKNQIGDFFSALGVIVED